MAETPNNGTSVVPYSETISNLYAVVTTGYKGTLASFDPSTEEGAEMLVKASLGEVPNIKEIAGQQINLTHFYAHGAAKTHDNGEVDEWTRIVLFDDKGRAFSAGSMGVAKSLAILMQVRKSAKFDPPVLVTVKMKSLGGNRLWIELIPDMNSLLNRKERAKGR